MQNARHNLGRRNEPMKRDDNARKSARRNEWKDKKGLEKQSKRPKETKMGGLWRA